jgi:hypothetical protein
MSVRWWHRKFFFGWQNFKWFFIEVLKTFSSEHSWLSSKRIERALLFTAALFLIVRYTLKHIPTMSSSDLLIIVGPLFIYAGYNTSVIRTEKKKKEHENNEPKPDTPPVL